MLKKKPDKKSGLKKGTHINTEYSEGDEQYKFNIFNFFSTSVGQYQTKYYKLNSRIKLIFSENSV
jgi:hypothetical protein